MTEESILKKIASLDKEVRKSLQHVQKEHQEWVMDNIEFFTKIHDSTHYLMVNSLGLSKDHPNYEQMFKQRLNRAVIQAYESDNSST